MPRLTTSMTSIDNDISISCINRILKENGLLAMHSVTKTKLKKYYRITRMNFAEFHRNDIDWIKAIFADECCFISEKGEIRFVKRPKYTRHEPLYVNLTQTIAFDDYSKFGQL